MSVNLERRVLRAQAAAVHMRKQGGGKIVNVGSLTFERAVPNVALYGISKGGMRHMTHALALEWAKDNINVNAIAPGRFWTAMTDAVFSDPDKHASAVEVIPMRRPGIASDLAGACVLLASDAGALHHGRDDYDRRRMDDQQRRSARSACRVPSPRFAGERAR